MPEPIATTGALGAFGAKLIPPLAGFAGAVITLSYMPELSKRQWVTAILSGTFLAYYVPPFIVAGLTHYGIAAWLPTDGSIEGLCGLLLGMGSIHIVGGATTLGRRFSADPVGTILRWGRKK